jgi:hypothetical protein
MLCVHLDYVLSSVLVLLYWCGSCALHMLPVLPFAGVACTRLASLRYRNCIIVCCKGAVTILIQGQLQLESNAAMAIMHGVLLGISEPTGFRLASPRLATPCGSWIYVMDACQQHAVPAEH